MLGAWAAASWGLPASSMLRRQRPRRFAAEDLAQRRRVGRRACRQKDAAAWPRCAGRDICRPRHVSGRQARPWSLPEGWQVRVGGRHSLCRWGPLLSSRRREALLDTSAAAPVGERQRGVLLLEQLQQPRARHRLTRREQYTCTHCIWGACAVHTLQRTYSACTVRNTCTCGGHGYAVYDLVRLLYMQCVRPTLGDESTKRCPAAPSSRAAATCAAAQSRTSTIAVSARCGICVGSR